MKRLAATVAKAARVLGMSAAIVFGAANVAAAKTSCSDDGTCGPHRKPPVTVDSRLFRFQGLLGGQWDNDTVQVHSEGYRVPFRYDPVWCNDCTPGQSGPGQKQWGTFYKEMFIHDNGQLCGASGQPIAHNIKTSLGYPVEYGCTDNNNTSLFWETSGVDAVTNTQGKPRKFQTHIWKNTYQDGVLWSPVDVSNGMAYFLDMRVQNYTCNGGNLGNPIVDPARPGRSLTGVKVFGPYPIDTPQNRAAAFTEWKVKGLIDLLEPFEDAIPQGWYKDMPASAGFPGGKTELLIYEHFLNLACGSFDCENYTETYTYGTVNRASGFGLMRWNAGQKQNGSRHVFQEITFNKLVAETGIGRVQPANLCEVPRTNGAAENAVVGYRMPQHLLAPLFTEPSRDR